MTVSDYIFKFLYEKGCKQTYMVSGSSAMWLTDALYRNKDMKAICTNHEQAAAMAADGYARVNEVPGACLVTIGPGATNAITGVAQAYFDSSPIFVISGQANSKLLQYAIDTGIRQNACQSLIIEPLVSGVTKYCKTVMNPDDIVMVMNEAYKAAMSGRKGPVWIDVPVDVQNMQVSDKAISEVKEEKICSPNDDIDYEEIISLLKKSKKPLILSGYGVRDSKACGILKEFSEKYSIPVVTSRGGIDTIASSNELYIGRPGGYGDRASHFAIQECDLLFILGSRLSVSTIGYYPDRLAQNATKIMIDIDEKELERDAVPIQIKYKCDINYFLEKLMDKLKNCAVGEFSSHVEWINHCVENRKIYPVVLKEYKEMKPLNLYYFIDILSELAPAETNIVVDTGSVYCMTSQSWKIKEGQRYIASGGFSSMGSWATALGVAQEGKNVIAISGDGSTQMNIQELATLKYNKIPVKLFVINNHGYMLIRHNQHNYMNDRFLGVGSDSGVESLDFSAIAKAYGICNFRITADDNIEEKINEVLKYDGPVLCEVMVQEFAEIQPKIASKVMPDGSLKAAEFDDLYPFIDRRG
ncbi:MAG: thiamine pyrophosphate-binding protein [Agathobacter sp.]|nr:thiamine pyrophosphate-binding protein [Agathobacter sp.]